MAHKPGLTVKRMALADLVLDPRNARVHSEKNLDAIISSLRKFGQQKPIVVTADNLVVAGNGTMAAAAHLGWGEIDVVVTSLKGKQATAYGLADNRTAELAMWDDDVLSDLLKELGEVGEAAGLGWDAEELVGMADLLYPDLDKPSDPPAPPPEPVSREKKNHCPACGHEW